MPTNKRELLELITAKLGRHGIKCTSQGSKIVVPISSQVGAIKRLPHRFLGAGEVPFHAVRRVVQEIADPFTHSPHFVSMRPAKYVARQPTELHISAHKL